MNDTGKPFPTEPYVRQAACRVVTICQVIIQHMVNFRQPVPTPGRTQVFAAPLDYCKATKPIKQQAAGSTPPPVVLRIATRVTCRPALLPKPRYQPDRPPR